MAIKRQRTLEIKFRYFTDDRLEISSFRMSDHTPLPRAKCTLGLGIFRIIYPAWTIPHTYSTAHDRVISQLYAEHIQQVLRSYISVLRSCISVLRSYISVLRSYTLTEVRVGYRH